MLSLKVLGENPSLCLFSCWWLSVIFGIPWFGDVSLQFLPPLSHGIFRVFVFTVFPLCMHLYLNFPLLRLPVIGIGSALIQYNCILTNYICEDPISKSDGVLKFWVGGPEFQGHTLQPVILMASSVHWSCSVEKSKQHPNFTYPNGSPY